MTVDDSSPLNISDAIAVENDPPNRKRRQAAGTKFALVLGAEQANQSGPPSNFHAQAAQTPNSNELACGSTEDLIVLQTNLEALIEAAKHLSDEDRKKLVEALHPCSNSPQPRHPRDRGLGKDLWQEI